MSDNLEGSAAWLSLARISNLVLGTLLVPLLIHLLGGEGFSAWAILLGGAALFAQLDAGVSSALVRFAAVPVLTGDRDEGSRLASTAITYGTAVYGSVLPLVVVAAPAFAAWAQLPPGRLLTAPALVVAVYAAVALRSLLQHGHNALYAAREFHLVALLSFLQAALSNAAALTAAWLGRSLDVTLLCFLSAQLLVMMLAFVVAVRRLGWSIRPALADRARWLRLVRYGLSIQTYEWAHAVSFQITKFVVLGMQGLWDVARYEAAGRATLAFRSIPGAGMDAFMPSTTVGLARGERTDEQFVRMALLAGWAVLGFVAAPLAIAPVWLYAWVGEMGYVSRWAFGALGLGAAASLLATPAAVICQALGRPGLQVRAGVVSLLLTPPLAFAIGRVAGMEGAALGSSLAVCIGSVALLVEVGRAAQVPVWSGLRLVVRRVWPMAIPCLLWGVAVHVSFGSWLHGADLAVRYTSTRRLAGAAAAVVLYGLCVLSMVAARLAAGGLHEYERRFVERARALATARRA